MKRLAVGLVLGMSACSDPAPSSSVADASSSPDAPPPSCRATDAGQRTPRGTLTIGTGLDGFVPLGEELPLEYGLTGGYRLTVNLQMTGLVPGDLSNVLAEGNPRTRISATFVDRDVPLTPGAFELPYAYKASPSGQYELPMGVGIWARLCWRGSDLIGQRVRLEAEILDADCGYASDVRVVTVTAGPGLPSEEHAPGCEAP